MKPEKTLFKNFKKHCNNLLITSIECWNIGGIPDVLLWTPSCENVLVELKYCDSNKTNKVKFSPHQILYFYQRKNLTSGQDRNLILVGHLEKLAKGDPLTRVKVIPKLYGSNSVEGLMLDIREVKPLATSWDQIEKIISNQKNN